MFSNVMLHNFSKNRVYRLGPLLEQRPNPQGATQRAENALAILCSSNGTPERSGRTPALPYPLVSKFIVQLCVGQNIKLLRYCEAEITSPDQGLASSRTGMAAETRS